MKPFAVLFVCMGNLCRSPSAHAVLRQCVERAGLAAQVHIDSAGTHASRGERPDRRAQDCARRRGYDLSDLRSRPLLDADFARFDLVLAMDEANERHLRRLCPPAQQQRVRRLTDFCLRQSATAVPDPYYGNAQGFEEVLSLLEDACAGVLLHVQQHLDRTLADVPQNS